jgi:hypothetical protein
LIQKRNKIFKEQRKNTARSGKADSGMIRLVNQFSELWVQTNLEFDRILLLMRGKNVDYLESKNKSPLMKKSRLAIASVNQKIIDKT